MTANKLINNINNKIHEFGFDYITYHSLMEYISECVKEYDDEYKIANMGMIRQLKKLEQENNTLRHMVQRMDTVIKLK